MFQFEIVRMVVDPYSLSERSYIILPLSRFVRQLIHTQFQKHHTQYIVHQSRHPLRLHLQILTMAITIGLLLLLRM
jgi:hypothetical protein